MRDYRKLWAFELADKLALETYRCTRQFPPEEKYGLVSQMRRAAVSIPSNIVEGSSREGHGEYVRFLDIGFASARELEYQASLAYRLGLIEEVVYRPYEQLIAETLRVLAGLLKSLRRQGPVT